MLAAVSVVLVFLFAGCGGLSTSSPIQDGLGVGAGGPPPGRVVPNGPSQGSTQEQILRGFLRAGAVSDGDFAVARSFLSDVAGQAWQPDSSVTVFSDESDLKVVKVNATTLRLRATAVASIDATGHFRNLPPGTVSQATMRFAKDDTRQWRISALPHGFGVWLSSAELDRLYEPFKVSYVSTGDRSIVPDVRWFPTGTGLATRLAKAQLDPVPGYLAGAARSEVPTGTRLTVDSVPVESGVATVDLSVNRLSTDPAVRQNLWAQFVATLTQAPGVQRVALSVEGAKLDLPGLNGPPSSISDLGFESLPSPPQVKPLLRTGTQLQQVEPGVLMDDSRRSRTPASPTGFPPIPRGWVWLALSRTGTELAAVGGDQKQLSRWRGTTHYLTAAFGTNLTRPAYDRHDVLWVGAQGAGGQIWTINSSADPKDQQKSGAAPLDVRWLHGRIVIALRASPDGTRLAVVSTDASGRDPQVDVTGVVRAPNGLPQRLSIPLRLGETLTTARDVVWLDDTSVAILGRVLTSELVRPYVVDLGGAMRSLADVEGANAVTTTGGPRGLVVSTESGQIMLRAGRSWIQMASGSDFVVPGV